MITNEVEKFTPFSQVMKGNDISSQYKNIPYRLQGVSGEKPLIFTKFQVKI
jgi:hypothetical protein